MAQGDLYFWYGTGSVFDKIIAWWTRSPFVHVSIDIGDGQQVEALGAGIVKDTIPTQRRYVQWSYSNGSKDSDPADMAMAIEWLKSVIGQPYSWLDDITAASPFRDHFYVVQVKKIHCCGLAIQYLVKAGGVDLKGLDLQPDNSTPAKLAQVLGVKG